MISNFKLQDSIDSMSNHLEFSPDGNFLFLGRLDRWFSLEKGNVEHFPQFLRLGSSYEWGSFTLDKRWVVVKPYSFLFESNDSCCWLCLLNYLCLWAAEEIVQGQESETICGCFPHRLLVQIRPSAGEDEDYPVPAMRILLNILRRTHHNEWCSLLEKLQFSYPFETRCRNCPSRMRCETPTLTVVRDFVISHYNDIFKYQVWDVQTGKSALEQAFSSGVQLSPFTYLCHVGTALEKCGVLFCGIDKSLSLCNIALLSTVCNHLFFFEFSRRRLLWKEFAVFEGFSIINNLTGLNSVLKQFVETEVESKEQQCELLDELNQGILQMKRLERLKSLERSAHLDLHEHNSQPTETELLPVLEELEMLEQREGYVLPQGQPHRRVLDRIELGHLKQLKLLERLERLTQFERLGQRGQLEDIEQFEEIVSSRRFRTLVGRGLLVLSKAYILLKLFPWRELHQSWSKRFPQFKQLVHQCWYHLESEEKFKFEEAFHFGTDTFTNSPLELQNLPDVKQKGLFTSILPCVSPDGKWIAIRLEGDETTVQLYREQLQRQHHPYWTNPVYVLKGVEHFTFTNDSMFFLYLTVLRSLHSLSLVTGTILTSVSGVRPLRSTPEKQAGYCFQGDDEETIIFVKDFPTVFLSSLLPVVRAEPIQVAFASADAILVLYSDCKLALIVNDGTAIASEKSLVHPFGGSQQVKKVQFSPDGKLIVTHQGTNILLYRTVPVSDEASTELGKYLDSVFEANMEFIVLHFTFSADSTLLLFCVRRSNDLSFFVWNVQKKVLSASFDSPGLMSEDFCCCFSLDEEGNNKEIIICTEFYIEFWDHTSRPCFLLRKVVSNVPYTIADKFTVRCTVSPKNDLLAYCITDRILLCPLKTSTDQCIRQLPRAHKGKVEFCQFLRGNRYLISYGVDGTMFLWDLSEWKAVAFAKIAQGRESIVNMAVSAEGDKVVCVTSFGRLNVIKPCGVKYATLSKLPLPKEMGSGKVTEAFHGQARELITAIHDPHCPGNTEDLDAAQLRIEEMEYFALSDDNEYSDEDSD